MGSKWLEVVAGKVILRCAAAAFALGAAAPAAAQFEDKTCVVLDSAFSIIIVQSAFALGFKEFKSSPVESGFIADLQSQQWDLIGIERGGSKVVNKQVILDLFKQQHAGGARFLVSYAHLDEWPELQEFMGVESAVDAPLSNKVVPPGPGNPIWFENEGGATAKSMNWSDNGDFLVPAPGSIVVTEFPTGEPAGVLTADRTRIVEGWNFDEYVSTFEVSDHIIFLLGCGADYNRDGTLTVQDFLNFQSFFGQVRGQGNFDFDDQLTVFDFLAFVNEFFAGCPH